MKLRINVPMSPGASSSTRTEKSPCETRYMASVRSFIGRSCERPTRTAIIIAYTISTSMMPNGEKMCVSRKPGTSPRKNSTR